MNTFRLFYSTKSKLLLWSILSSLVTLSLVNVNASNSLKKVDKETIEGRDVTMNCQVPMEVSDHLYSIKWYKKHNGVYYEFYSYIKSPEEVVHHKLLPGVYFNVKQTMINGIAITLTNITLLSEGFYKCELIIDDTFQTLRTEFNVSVVVPLNKSPEIFSNKKIYNLGDLVVLTCVSGYSRPQSNIEWLINGQPILSSYLIAPPSTSKNEQEKIKVNRSKLQFRLRYEHLIDGEHFAVQCKSFLNNLFLPEKISSVKLSAWHETTPIIVGLKDEYRLGDHVRLNCTVPVFYSQVDLDKTFPNEPVKLEWIINGQTAKEEDVINYFTYGHIGLDILFDKKLVSRNTFSIQCKSLQKWAKRKLPHKFYVLNSNNTQTILIYKDNPTLESETNVTTNEIKTRTESKFLLGKINDTTNNSRYNAIAQEDITLVSYLTTEIPDLKNFTKPDDSNLNHTESETTTNYQTFFSSDNNSTMTTLVNFSTIEPTTKTIKGNTSDIVNENKDNSTSLISSIKQYVLTTQPKKLASYGVTLLPLFVITLVLILG